MHMVKKMTAEAREIYRRAVTSVLPHHMIKNILSREEADSASLKVGNFCTNLNKNVYVVGFGKAVLGMARALEDFLGDHIVNGIISVPKGIQEELAKNGKTDMLLSNQSKIKVFEGARNNLPDEDAYQATIKITDLAKRVGKRDVLFVLISGGGSALLTAPVPQISLADKIAVTNLLVSKGADINSLNAVRQNLSTVKGGGLATMAYPAQTFGLILSDIVGDPVDKIASGPTVEKLFSKRDALEIINRLKLTESIPKNVKEFLLTKSDDQENNKGPGFSHVKNLLIGTNSIAVEAALNYASSIGYASTVLSSTLVGESKEVGKSFAMLAHSLCRSMADGGAVDYRGILWNDNKGSSINLNSIVREASEKKQPICLISGGETTVRVVGKGWGGRNQEMVLSFGIQLDETMSPNLATDFEITFLSAGTDGIDSNTPAAGALSYLGQMKLAKEMGLDPVTFLAQNDSHNFFRQFNSGNDLIITGHTGTNVMDIQILIIKHK